MVWATPISRSMAACRWRSRGARRERSSLARRRSPRGTVLPTSPTSRSTLSGRAIRSRRASMPRLQLDKEEISTQVKDRIFLAHAEDDKVVKISDFQENVEILDLQPDDYFITNSGGHSLIFQEASIFGKVHLFYKERAHPVTPRITKKEIE